MKTFRAALLGSLAFAFSSAWAQGTPPTDPQIAAIVVTANQVDIDAGKLAKAKSANKDVKVKPEESPTSKSLKEGGDQNLANLKGQKGAEFDRAYIDHEVTYHQNVLDALDKTLIPNAQNGELKALLVKVRPAFVAHLEHAKQVQAELAKKA